MMTMMIKRQLYLTERIQAFGQKNEEKNAFEVNFGGFKSFFSPHVWLVIQLCEIIPQMGLNGRARQLLVRNSWLINTCKCLVMLIDVWCLCETRSARQRRTIPKTTNIGENGSLSDKVIPFFSKDFHWSLRDDAANILNSCLWQTNLTKGPKPTIQY